MSERRIGWFKHVRLGDLMLAGHPVLAGVIQSPEWGRATWSNQATATDRGASAFYRATVRATLRRTSSDPNETPREFGARRITWLRDLVAAAGFGAQVEIYEPSGPLAITEDRNAHVTTSVDPIVAGSGSSFQLTADIGLVDLGAWVYLSDGTRAEVARVTDWDSDGPGLGGVVQCEEVLNGYDAGALVARVEWWLPEARLTREIRMTGNELGSYEAAKDIDLTFESQQAPEVGL